MAKQAETFAVLTGPITGEITLDDGTTYDVTPYAVEVKSAEHAQILAHRIGVHYEQNGHPAVEGDFTYEKGDN